MDLPSSPVLCLSSPSRDPPPRLSSPSRDPLLRRVAEERGRRNPPSPSFSQAISLSHRRRLGVVKQWSMDETQSWFQRRSGSQEREAGGGGRGGRNRRIFHRRLATASAPCSTDSEAEEEVAVRALEEALRATALHQLELGMPGIRVKGERLEGEERRGEVPPRIYVGEESSSLGSSGEELEVVEGGGQRQGKGEIQD